VVYDDAHVQDILEKICKKLDRTWLVNDSDLWLLKEPIPFDQVDSNSWLLDSSTNLADYATRVFRAEILIDLWTNRDKRCLHAVVRLGGAKD